jgi:hypothetical protein
MVDMVQHIFHSLIKFDLNFDVEKISKKKEKY